MFGALLAFVVLALLVIYRDRLDTRELDAALVKANKNQVAGSGLDFMKLPAVWMCFAFFAFTAMALGVIQSFTPAALKASYGTALAMGTACVTAYMLANAAGTLAGGFLAARSTQHDRVIAGALGAAALIAATIATGMIPTALLILFFALMGFGSGLAGPSRDLLVRAAAPKNATGRVYGVVYSGLDAGLAIAPPIFGAAMDGGHPLWLFSMMSVFFIAALVAAMNVGAKTDSAARRLAQTSKPAH